MGGQTCGQLEEKALKEGRKGQMRQKKRNNGRMEEEQRKRGEGYRRRRNRCNKEHRTQSHRVC